MQKDNKLLVQLSQAELESLIGNVLQHELLKVLKPTPQAPKVKLLTRKETAKLLGISLPTLSEYTKQGKLTSYIIGSSIRYKEAEVIADLKRLP